MAEKRFAKLPFIKGFNLKPGEDLIERFQVYIDDAVSNQTTCSAKLTVTDEDTAEAVIGERAVTPDDAANAEYTLLITAADSADWTGPYTYEFVITWPVDHADIPEGATRTYLEGSISVG